MPKKTVSPDNAPKPVGPYSPAVKAGSLVFASGQIALGADGEVVHGDVQAQTRAALENLKNVLAAAGASLDKVVKTTVFLQDMSDFAEMNEVYAEFFPEAPPARSAVAVKELPKEALVEIEAVASLD